jgi:hypothetical protein
VGEKVMHVGVFAIGILVILAASSCDSIKPRPDPPDQVVNRLIEKYRDGPIGRWQILAMDKQIVKLDTMTGETWALKGSQWEPLVAVPATVGGVLMRAPDGSTAVVHPADVEAAKAKGAVVVPRPPLSSFDRP